MHLIEQNFNGLDEREQSNSFCKFENIYTRYFIEGWSTLYKNPNAIYILENNQHHFINWYKFAIKSECKYDLAKNSNTFYIMVKYMDELDLYTKYTIKYNLIKRADIIREELIKKIMHPNKRQNLIILLNIDFNHYYQNITYDVDNLETYYVEYSTRQPFKYELDYEYLKMYINQIKQGANLERISYERLERIFLEQYKLKYYNDFDAIDIDFEIMNDV